MFNKMLFWLFCLVSATSHVAAYDQDFVIRMIQEGFEKQDLEAIYKSLDLWADICPEKRNEARVIQSYILGGMGFEEAGRDLLINHLDPLKEKGYHLDDLKLLYNLFDTISRITGDNCEVVPCKRKDNDEPYQPSGLKMKYWLGAGAVVLGFIVSPFSLPAAGFLISTGASTLFDVVPDLLENKEKHDQGLLRYDRETQKKIEEGKQ